MKRRDLLSLAAATPLLATLEASAEQDDSFRVVQASPEEVTLYPRDPDMAVYLVDHDPADGFRVVLVWKPKHVVVPLFEPPTDMDLAEVKKTLLGCVQNHVQISVDDQSYDGILYTDGYRIGLLAQGLENSDAGLA